MKSEPPRLLSEQLKLYLVLETSMIKLPLGDFIMQAVEGGVTAIQLRDKTSSPLSRYETAKQIVSLINGKDTLFIINNNVDLAVAVGADGVHAGVEDLPPKVIKQYFPDLIVGYSCNNNEDCLVAQDAQVDYLGIGPAYFTTTKNNLRPIIGTEGIAKLAKSIEIPSIAIGGINLSNLKGFQDIGLAGVAVSSALCQSEHPYDTAMEFIKILNKDERV